jgi:hypothetical protein
MGLASFEPDVHLQRFYIVKTVDEIISSADEALRE